MIRLIITLGICACSTDAAPLPTQTFSPTQTLLIELSTEPAQTPTITPQIDIAPQFGFTHQRCRRESLRGGTRHFTEFHFD
ncbi:MAG: hypothetical protein ISS57_08615 [Anaerolineales bacterium]|nr:hypothetical protein [Anaerolineales bacterium]